MTTSSACHVRLRENLGAYFKVYSPTRISGCRRLLTNMMAVISIFIPFYGVDAQETLGCGQAAAIAERDAALPPGLLQAIGRVESGRLVQGQIVGWPLSVNAGGVSRQFDRREEAIAYVRDQSASGVRLVDVGCFQIDQLYHPEAFDSGQDEFDPQENATAASHILQVLHTRTGDWNQAVALYHSSDPKRSMPYLQAVLSSWATGHGSGVATTTLMGPSDPFTILTSTRASSILVWGPTNRPPHGVIRNSSSLPNVITP